MKAEKIQKALSSYKAGTFVNLKWQKVISSKKALDEGICIIKECEGLVRLGVQYSHLKSAKDLIQSATGKTPWYKHAGYCTVVHKEDPSKKYLQVYTVPGQRTRTGIQVIGSTLSVDELIEGGYILKSALHSKPDLTVFTLSYDNVVKFGTTC